ncbi:MAG TPA: FMN-binding protein [Caldimonas sp.]|nr:FMN-binding protein [Caldimonas sp.]
MLPRSPASRACFVCAAAVPALVSASAFATTYLSAAQAEQALFPDATAFVAKPLALTPEQSRAIAAQAQTPLQTAFWKVFAATSNGRVLGYVITDSVIGKFDLIDYAVGVAPDGTIRGVEILAYREAHGGEVRTPAWRSQFVGKNAKAPLSVGVDIANISGATLSCTHLTDGIRRIADYATRVLAAGG